MSAHDDASLAAEEIRARTNRPRHDVALVLGSGWGPAAERLGAADVEIPMDELTGFIRPTVTGQRGTVRSVPVGGGHALVFVGRTHLYEGHGVAAVAHGVRAAVL